MTFSLVVKSRFLRTKTLGAYNNIWHHFVYMQYIQSQSWPLLGILCCFTRCCFRWVCTFLAVLVFSCVRYAADKCLLDKVCYYIMLYWSCECIWVDLISCIYRFVDCKRTLSSNFHQIQLATQLQYYNLSHQKRESLSLILVTAFVFEGNKMNIGFILVNHGINGNDCFCVFRSTKSQRLRGTSNTLRLKVRFSISISYF